MAGRGGACFIKFGPLCRCASKVAAYLNADCGHIFVVINLIVDLLYYAVDPRLRVDRAGTGH